MGSDRYQVRLASRADVAALHALMKGAIETHLKAFLSPEQVAASHEIMGLDTQLIDDGCYFVILDDMEIVASGGWSRRETMFGGDNTVGRSARLLDPERDPARIRAMYVSAARPRQGLGRRVTLLCEEAARAAGFNRAELAATASGKPLYLACGYRVEREFEHVASNGVLLPLTLMGKRL